MAALHNTKNDPLDGLVERLNELTKQLPSPNSPRSISPPEVRSQAIGPAELEILEEFMLTLKRIEAAQTQSAAELRDVVQAIGRIAPVLQQGTTLSDDGIGKLRVALGAETRGNAERRILAELAEIKAGLRRARKGRRMAFIVFALGLVLAGIAVGALTAPFLRRLFDAVV